MEWVNSLFNYDTLTGLLKVKATSTTQTNTYNLTAKLSSYPTIQFH